MEIKGKYTSAKVFTDNIEEVAIEQIKEICNQEIFKDSKIRIMPDVHAGKGCVIGFTAEYTDKIIPNLIGVDIGCGILTVELGNIEIDFKELDEIINKFVPSGQNVHKEKDDKTDYWFYKSLKCSEDLENLDRINNSIGTLGGGNHFIEVDIDELGNKYLVIHTGSRNLGNQVANLYQEKAIKNFKNKHSQNISELIESLKRDGKEKNIQEEIKKYKLEHQININEDLMYLEGKMAEDYLYDMNICQHYAIRNREAIAYKILIELLGVELGWYNNFHTVHNYIDLENRIIRKGAISAKKGEKILIPINMRDGSILAVGKGNEEWNNSAPHGAGRLMGRADAKRKLNLEDFKDSMSNIYTTSVNAQTLDEAPMAYKSLEEIIENTKDTVDIISILKPIYNFKAH